MDIVDNTLYTLMQDFVNSFIIHLKSDKNIVIEKDITTLYKPTHISATKTTNASLTLFEEKISVNDFPTLVIRNKNEIDSSMIGELEEYLKNKYSDKCRPNVWLNFLMKYLEIVDEIIMNQAQFDLLYDDFQKFLGRENIPIRILTLIPNLIIESEYIILGKNEKLIQMDEADFNFIYNNTLDKNYLHKLLLPGYGTIYEQKFTQSLDTEENPIDQLSRDTMLTSLKLFSAGDITLHNSIAQISNPFYHSQSLNAKEQIPKENLQTNFLLPKNKEKEFIDFYKLINKERPSLSFFIKLSLARFEGSYFRKTDDDKLVDLMIALETLFLQQGSSDSHKLALYISWMIGTDFKERKKIYKFISDAYDCRNVIVHGSNAKSTTKFRKDMQKKLNTLKDYYRRSLTQIIDEKYHKLKKEKLTKNITDKILGK